MDSSSYEHRRLYSVSGNVNVVSHLWQFLTFLNEITCKPETLFNLDAKVIDSCIDIIISRQVIREHHLITKIPHYFDEPNRSEPQLSQSVEPVTLASMSASRVAAPHAPHL